VRGFLKGLGELLFPVDVKCALCGGERGILAGSGICECCYGELPLEFMGEQVLGVSCFWALEYQDKAREMIHGLKFDNKRYLARTLGYLMLECYRAHLMGLPIDGICPMPLHRNRLRKRGFNQSLLLAQELSEGLGIPVYPDGLRRIRDTRPQMELTREERLKNVEGAFVPGMEFQGRCILLIDDVLTTGASVRECAQVVQTGGGSVVCFCAARRE